MPASERQIRRERRAICKLAAEQAHALGHDLTKFKEYKSTDGKYTAYCHTCGMFAIVYDRPPQVGDQISGWALTKQCGQGGLRGEESKKVVEPQGDATGSTIGGDLGVDAEGLRSEGRPVGQDHGGTGQGIPAAGGS